MEIQCKSCKTRYNFDETLVTGDGIWVRCSRCQNVFFQASLPEVEISADKEKGWDDTQVVPVREEPDYEEALQDELQDDVLPEPQKKSSRRTWILAAVLTVLLACLAALFLYPPVGDLVLKQISDVFPAAGGLLSGPPEIQPPGPAQVKLVDLKQRFVENAIMGKMRIVEGMAANASSEPMTRIKVRAELYDVLGTPVRQSASYCGNLLTDQELKTATEEQIARKLSTPHGTEVSNDRITPKGMIPFMIIFLREPPGVTKALVVPAEAERLLP